MNKKEIIKYAVSIAVVGVTATTIMYVTKRILINTISKKTGEDKDTLKEKNILELYKIKRELPRVITDETTESKIGLFGAIEKAVKAIEDSKKAKITETQNNG